jgi:hypothetical protein
MKTLSGCGSRKGNEIDGLEFDITTLGELIQTLKSYREVHLTFLGDEEVDLWVKVD